MRKQWQGLQGPPRDISLSASQPALSIGDPVVAILLGVVVFREKLGGGVMPLLELGGVVAMVYGIITVAHSPVSRDQDEVDPGNGAQAEDRHRTSA